MSRGNVRQNGPRESADVGWMVKFARACEVFLASRGERTLTRAEIQDRAMRVAKREKVCRAQQGQRRKDKADAIADELEKGWG